MSSSYQCVHAYLDTQSPSPSESTSPKKWETSEMACWSLSTSSSTLSTSNHTHKLSHSCASCILTHTSGSHKSKQWYVVASDAFEIAMKTNINSVTRSVENKGFTWTHNSVVAGKGEKK